MTTSTLLKSQIQNILNKWGEIVRIEITPTRNLEKIALYSSLPIYLEEISNGLSTSPGSEGYKKFLTSLLSTCREHGQHRSFLETYSLDQIITEYRILRKTIFDFLERENPLTLGERDKILDSIDSGISEASIAFTKAKDFVQVRLNQESKRDLVNFKFKLEQSHKTMRAAEVQRDESQNRVTDLKKERDLRDTFVSTLSHDLRNPLSSIRACAELILHTPKEVQKHTLLAARIIGSLDRTDKMIIDLLDFNRFYAAGAFQLELSTFDLNLLIHDTLEELATVYGNRFVFHPDGDLIVFWSLEGIRRVLENLLVNAVKYGDATSSIWVSVQKYKDKIDLKVLNFGNPISVQDQADIFKPFYKLKSTIHNEKKGWGIGLALIKGIAESHGGSVQVKSSLQEGTTFTVSLPWSVPIS